MRPFVVCHMIVSLDGRTQVSRWHPYHPLPRQMLDKAYEELDCGAWLVGRITGQEYGKGGVYATIAEPIANGNWIISQTAEVTGSCWIPMARSSGSGRRLMGTR